LSIRGLFGCIDAPVLGLEGTDECITPKGMSHLSSSPLPYRNRWSQ